MLSLSFLIQSENRYVTFFVLIIKIKLFQPVKKPKLYFFLFNKVIKTMLASYQCIIIENKLFCDIIKLHNMVLATSTQFLHMTFLLNYDYFFCQHIVYANIQMCIEYICKKNFKNLLNHKIKDEYICFVIINRYVSVRVNYKKKCKVCI